MVYKLVSRLKSVSVLISSLTSQLVSFLAPLVLLLVMVPPAQPGDGSRPQLVVYESEEEDVASPTSPLRLDGELDVAGVGGFVVQAIPLPGEVVVDVDAVPVHQDVDQGKVFLLPVLNL